MKIVIPEGVYDKVMHWVNKVDFEVSGFGTVKYDKETQEFTVVDAYLLKQEGGACHTDIDANALNKLMFTSMNDEGDLRWWWHSHVKMNTFWSGTDTATIKELGNQGWIVATVFNQLNSMKSAVAYLSESEFGKLLHYNDDIPTQVDRLTYDDETLAGWDKEFTDNVEEKKFYTPTISSQSQYSFNDAGAWEYRRNSREEKDPETKTPLSFKGVTGPDWDPGLLGYGAKLEAQALGLSPENYSVIISNPDNAGVIEGYENRLTMAEMQGYFDKGLYDRA